MKYFQCIDCKYFWKIIFSDNGKNTKLACPECKSLNICQIEKIRGWDREGRYTSIMKDHDRAALSPESSIIQKGQLKEDSPSPRKLSIKGSTFLIRIVLIQGRLNGFIERFVRHSP